jgi:tetratricopeptide (TPR) repeat protein
MVLLSETSHRRRRRSRPIAAAISGLLFASHRREPRAAMKTEVQPRERLRTITLVVFALVLLWLVVSHSLALYLADVAPKATLWLSPGEPEALVNLADRSLNGGAPFFSAEAEVQRAQGQAAGSGTSAAGSAGGAAARTSGTMDNNSNDNTTTAADDSSNVSEDVDAAFKNVGRNQSIDLSTIRAEAESALMDDPLDPRALRILGQAADAAKNDPDAVKFMQAAAQMSSHESVADYWLMIKSTEAGDYKTAIAYGDVLLRANLELGPYVAPLLAHFADNEPSASVVKALILSNPPWRQMFFAFLPRSVADVRTPLGILLALKASPTPPTSEEVGGYLTYLIEHKYFDLAYYAWLQLLPAEELQHVELLYNGNFAKAPSGLPFDWTITQGSGVTIDIVRDPDTDSGRALSVDFLYGRVDYHSVSELVHLAPGTYQFDGHYKGELIGPRGLKWRIACADKANAPIAESEMIGGVASTWKEMKFTFNVPDAGCRAQYVRLDLDARMASEQIVNGSMLFSGLNIARAGDASDSDESDSGASDQQKSNQ